MAAAMTGRQDFQAMQVTFTRTGERRYRVSVERHGIEPSYMDPAPGYDAKLPHDAAHFIVENELGVQGGVFGQLAAGGNAGSFRSDTLKRPRRAEKRSAGMVRANRDEALFSEHAVHVACTTWLGRREVPATRISPDELERICRAFDDFSTKWSKLGVGESITLAWNGQRARPQARRGHPLHR